MTRAASTGGVPRWAAPVSMVLCVLGLADAAYLVYEHYDQSATFLCSESAHINCAAVTTSRYSWMPPTHFQAGLLEKPHHVGFGIPVSDLGLVFFLVMTVLCLPAMWRHRSALVSRARLALVSLGVLSALYLVWVELIALHGTICLYCPGVHLITLALFILVVLATALREPEPV
ncbi:MAG TPA: vitamin K epoxide reductase family protein [Marmoricola sp.]